MEATFPPDHAAFHKTGFCQALFPITHKSVHTRRQQDTCWLEQATERSMSSQPITWPPLTHAHTRTVKGDFFMVQMQIKSLCIRQTPHRSVFMSSCLPIFMSSRLHVFFFFHGSFGGNPRGFTSVHPGAPQHRRWEPALPSHLHVFVF